MIKKMEESNQMFTDKEFPAVHRSI
jgi:hypothetical protein